MLRAAGIGAAPYRRTWQGTPEFTAHIDDMRWAQAYALANRDRMMDEALRSLQELVPFAETRRVNAHYNLTQMERHHGRDLSITRKGAIKADVDDDGVILEGRTWNADRAGALVDEIPDAYKDIDPVMAAQRDLVAIEHTLRQVFNYKG